MNKFSAWFGLYKSMTSRSGEAELLITRTKAFELEKEWIMSLFMQGTISASTAQADLNRAKLLFDNAPEVFNLH